MVLKKADLPRLLAVVLIPVLLSACGGPLSFIADATVATAKLATGAVKGTVKVIGAVIPESDRSKLKAMRKNCEKSGGVFYLSKIESGTTDNEDVQARCDYSEELNK